MNIEYSNSISVDEYIEIRASVEWPAISKRQVECIINKSQFLITVRIDGRLAGMSRIITDGGYVFFVADVIVHPDFQGKGIGRLLMEKVMEYIDSNIISGETTFINLMSIKGKEGFYEKFGFKKRPNEEFGCGMSYRYTKK